MLYNIYTILYSGYDYDMIYFLMICLLFKLLKNLTDCPKIIERLNFRINLPNVK